MISSNPSFSVEVMFMNMLLNSKHVNDKYLWIILFYAAYNITNFLHAIFQICKIIYHIPVLSYYMLKLSFPNIWTNFSLNDALPIIVNKTILLISN